MELSIIISIGLVLLGLILFFVLRKQTQINPVVSSKKKVEEELNTPEETSKDEGVEDSEPEYTEESLSELEDASRDLADKLREIKATNKSRYINEDDEDDEDDDEEDEDDDTSRDNLSLGKLLGIIIVIGVGILVASNVMDAVKEANLLQENTTTNSTELFSDIAQPLLNFNPIPILMMGLTILIIWVVFKGFTRNNYA